MIISFGEVNKKWILFIIVPSLYYLRHFIEKNLNKESKNLFFGGFIRFFARSLNSILWIILNHLTARKNKSIELINFDLGKDNNPNDLSKDNIRINQSRNLSQFEIEKEKNLQKKESLIELKKTSKFIIILILVIAIIFDFISVTISLLFLEFEIMAHVSDGLEILSICVRLIFFAVFSYFFIKSMTIYKHHYVSAIVILITVLFEIILSLIYDKEGNKDFWTKFILKLVPNILYSIAYTVGLKYLINSGNIYKFLSLCGIFEMLISIILQLIMSSIKCKEKNPFKENFNYCDKNRYYRTMVFNLKNFSNFGGYTTILLIITSFIEKLFEYLLIYTFSLNHYGAIYSIPTYFDIFRTDKLMAQKILYYIGGVIIIFMIFVFNEILILKFFDLDKNTKVEIMKRADIDFINQMKDEKLQADDDKLF